MLLPAIDALARIHDRDGPIRAFVEVAPSSGLPHDPGPLAGAGVAVKDLYRVDGMATRAGSTLAPELFAGPESDIVQRLRHAGAVVVGKTALDEFGYCEPPPTKNPRDLERTPGGSSGGSAAAVAAGMCDLAVGSQSLQSTIVPAAYCGIVGFKPTFDRWRYDGVPLSPSFDTVGFLASDLDALEQCLAATATSWQPVDDVDRRLRRIGIPTAWGRPSHRDGWERFGAHVRGVRDALGVELVRCEVPWNEDPIGLAAVVSDLLDGEMARVHHDWFAVHRERYRPRTAAAVERGLAVPDARLAECRKVQRETTTYLRDQLDALGLDGYACPSVCGLAPVGYEITGDSWMTCFWSLAGLPCLSIPTQDLDEPMPRGFQLVGAPGRDEDVIAFGREVRAVLARPR